MTPDEYGVLFKGDLEAFDAGSERSIQADAGKIGVSDLGTCRERVRRTMVRAAPSDAPDKTAAMVGTAVDQWVKQARLAARPDLLVDVELSITLPNGYVLLGHADEIDPAEPSVTDLKTKNGLKAIRAALSDDNHRWQRHLYALGAIQAGLVPESVTVRNIYLDRSGKDPEPHVEQEPFSMDVVFAAQAWLEDVLYAVEHGEEASKDWERGMCERYCPFFTACRKHDAADVAYLPDGPKAELLAESVAVKQNLDHLSALWDELKDQWKGTTARSRSHFVRSVLVNAKNPYYKVEVGEVR